MYEILQDTQPDDQLLAVIQDRHTIAVGRGRQRALRAALLMPGFNPDQPCVIAPVVDVDQTLGRVEYKQEKR